MRRPKLEEYWNALSAHLPAFSADEQRFAIGLYRELSKGQPVDPEQLSQALGLTVAESRRFLLRESIQPFVYPDDRGRIIGFGGLAAAPMHHCFEVDGRRLWTWCAWDSLFLPEILGKPARVQSADPASGEIVRLVVTPERIESAQPPQPVVSFLLPDADDFRVSSANLMTRFCHFVFFFASLSSGLRWAAKKPGTFLYSLPDAFALARRLNARNFGPALNRRCGEEMDKVNK